ncbi:MAG: hypothetical protein GY862_37400, partial [Gammaproteobacteria bacterium]|nr:hypothetical protein [Gammaproteobacteria bacterium]
ALEIRLTVINCLSFASHIHESNQARTHVFNIVEICSRQARGFDILLDAMRPFDDPIPLQNLYKKLQQIRWQPVTWAEVTDLKTILRNVNIPDAKVHEPYRKSMPDNPMIPDGCYQDMFMCLLDCLAKKSCTLPDKAPLLEFLERCETLIANDTDDEVQTKLSEWKEKVAKRLELNLATIRDRITTSSSPSLQTVPVLLIKIEPHLAAEGKFKARAWLFQDDTYTPQTVPDEDYTHAGLEALVPKLLGQIMRQLAGAGADLRIEAILPLELFDWDLNCLPVQLGPQRRPLCTRYPLTIRSWERLYHDDYALAKSQWFDKWTDGRLSDAELYRAYGDCHETLLEELENSARAFVTLTPMPPAGDRDKMFEILGTMLAAGIPFAFWILRDCEEPEEPVRALLDAHDCGCWPREILQRRKMESGSNQEKQLWRHMNVLWDDPRRRPPQGDPLTAPID